MTLLWRGRALALAVAVLVVLAVVPLIDVELPGLFPGALASPGTLQLLALCLTFAGAALAYNLLFGYTGLLSFGHALYFSAGVYVADIALSRWHWSLPAALGLTAAVALLLALVLGALSLRVTGIAFAMVTLAFAQAGSIIVFNNPRGLTGGEEGLGLDVDRLPTGLVGVVHTSNLYWIALAYLALTFAVSWWAVGSRPGRVWQAIRENERRVEVLGLRPYPFKLLAFVLSGFLTSVGGVVYLFLVGGATPGVTTANLSLALLLMVVLGGSATLWGPALGGFLYEYLDFRLVKVSASPEVAGLPGWLKAPLSEPLFILGVLFILLVLFFPGGVAGVARRSRRRRLAKPVLPAASVEGEAVTPEPERLEA